MEWVTFTVPCTHSTLNVNGNTGRLVLVGTCYKNTAVHEIQVRMLQVTYLSPC